MQSSLTQARRFAVAVTRLFALSLAFTFAASALADPPMRVARLGYFNGSVSFSPAGESDWVAGTLNRPLVSGDRLWVDDRARVELQIGSAAVRLAARTLFTLTNLDDRIAQMTLHDGTLNLRVRRLDRNQVVEVDTPNLAFVIRQAGEYRVTVDAARNSTEVRTRSGRADVFGGRTTYTVGLGRAYRFFGSGLTDYDVLTVPRADDFDRWSQARDRSYDTSVSARYVSPDVIGYQDLDQYGSWRSVPEYGNVWMPTRVSANWAPYRDGHWSWVEPWGWTWIDDLPWGFTVSHYGRWINSDGRWGWVPGPATARAVYAPALVAFIGGGNFAGGSTGRDGASVGWFPLGPREVYRPAYAVSRDYFTRVNVSNTVINTTIIVNNYDNRDSAAVSNVTYVNQRVPGAVVAVPTTTFVQAQPVARAVVRVSEAAIAGAPVTSLAAVAPVRTSVLGAAPERTRPPAVTDRRFVAQSQPPAAPVPFAVRERALANQPGKPVEAAVLATLKPAAPVLNGPTGQRGPGAPVAQPVVEVVPDNRGNGQGVVVPPPRPPSERRNDREQQTPAGQPPAAPAPVAPPASPTVGAPGRSNQPSESPGRPAIVVPDRPAPPAMLPPVAPARPENKPREQRDPQPMPPQGLPPAPGQPAPVAPPAARPAPPAAPQAAPDVPSRGNRPSDPAGRPAAVAPVPPVPPAVQPQTPPPPAGRSDRPREQRPAPAVVPPGPVPAPANVEVAPPTRQPQQSVPPEQGERNRGQQQRPRPEPPAGAPVQPPRAAPPAPAVVAAPAEAANTGNVPPKASKGEKKPDDADDKRRDKKNAKTDEEDKGPADDKEKKRK